jgi:hypothetical protein
MCKVSSKWVEGIISREAGGSEYYGFKPSDGGKSINWRGKSSFKQVTATDEASKAAAAVAEQKDSTFASSFPVEFQGLLDNESPIDVQRFLHLDALFLRLNGIAEGKMGKCIKTACAAVLAKSKNDVVWFRRDHIFIMRLLEGHMRPLSVQLDQKQSSLIFPTLWANLGSNSLSIAEDLKAVLSYDTGPITWPQLLSMNTQDAFVVRQLQQCHQQQPHLFLQFRAKVLELLRRKQLQRDVFVFHRDNISLFYLCCILDSILGHLTPLRYNYAGYSWQEFLEFARCYSEPKTTQFLFKDLAAVFAAIPMDPPSNAQLPWLFMEVYDQHTTRFCGNVVEIFLKGSEASRLFAQEAHSSAFFGKRRMSAEHFAPNAAKIIRALSISGFKDGDSVSVLVKEMISTIISFHENDRPEIILFKLHKEVTLQEQYGQSAISTLICSLTERSLCSLDPFKVMRFASELKWLQPWLLRRSLDSLLEKNLGLDPAFGDPRWDSLFNKAFASVGTTDDANDCDPGLTLQLFIEAGFHSCYDSILSFIRNLFLFLEGSDLAIKNIYHDEDDKEIQHETNHLIRKIFPSILTLLENVSAADLLQRIAVGSASRYGKIFSETLLACVIEEMSLPHISETCDNWLATINSVFFQKMLRRENYGAFGATGLAYAMQLLDKSVVPRFDAATNDLRIYHADQDALKRLCLQGVPFVQYLRHLPELEAMLSNDERLQMYPDNEARVGIEKYVERLRIFRGPFDRLVELFKTKNLQLRLVEILHVDYGSIYEQWLNLFPAHAETVSPAAIDHQWEQYAGYISYTQTLMKFVSWLDEIARMENAAEVYAQCQHIVARPEVQTLRDLESHTAELKSFVDTFGDVNRQFVEYFMEKDSALFQAYMTAQLKAALDDKNKDRAEYDIGVDADYDEDDDTGGQMLKIQEVKEAIKMVYGQIGDLLKKPDLKLSVLNDASKAMKLAGKTAEEELEIICGFHDYEGSKDMVSNFRLALKLSELCERLPSVIDVVEQYDLASCKASPGYRKLVDLVENQLRRREDLKFNEVPECLRSVEECFLGRYDGLAMDLFENIGSCAPFFNFVVEERFYDDGVNQGKDRFRRERDIITGNLMGEGEQVEKKSSKCYRLFPSFAANLVSSFVNCSSLLPPFPPTLRISQEYKGDILADLPIALDVVEPFVLAKVANLSFDNLLERLHALEDSHLEQPLKRLHTTREHFDKIALWFSGLEEQTEAAVTQTVEDILTSGRYSKYILYKRREYESECECM